MLRHIILALLLLQINSLSYSMKIRKKEIAYIHQNYRFHVYYSPAKNTIIASASRTDKNLTEDIMVIKYVDKNQIETLSKHQTTKKASVITYLKELIQKYEQSNKK